MALAPSVYSRNRRNASGCIVATSDHTGEDSPSVASAERIAAAASVASPRVNAAIAAARWTAICAKVVS